MPASQIIIPGATELGLGGCIIRTVNRYEIHNHFKLPEHLEIILVIAFGRPSEDVELTLVETLGNIAHFEDQNKVHFVTK